MPHINLLSPHVADLIAAGEVVERPASVIKELMENAFDAGAKNVTVEIHDGGATMIRITDDGCGMAPEDAGIAFLRNHATVSAMAWDFPTSHPMRMKSQSRQKKAPRAVADSSGV